MSSFVSSIIKNFRGGATLLFRDGTSSSIILGPLVIDDATTWNGVATAATYDVSSMIGDATKAVWALKDANNGYRQILADISHPDVTHVTVSVDIPLTAGTYRLVGVS